MIKNTPHGKRLHGSLRLVTLSGCLAMVYGTAIASPMATDYFRHIGFSEIHFGILSGLPMIMLAMQFVGAFWSNNLVSRRNVYMTLIISGRLLWIAGIFMPFVPGLSPAVRVGGMMVLIAISSMMQNMGPPIWFSWMGDLIPRRIVSRFWGGRLRWTNIAWLLTNVPLILFGFYYKTFGLTLTQAFTFVAALGTAVGIADILLFHGVWEPETAPVRKRRLLETLLEPLKQHQFRSYMIWNVAYSASTMIGAAFMMLYVLKVLGLPLWQVMLIWMTPGLGSALSARTWGRLIDRFGSRPVLVLCTSLKPITPIIFFIITRDTALVGLSLFFILDSVLNVGQNLSTNGFMLRMAPRDNRGMFVAAISSLPGLAGGLAAVAGGYLLKLWEGHSVMLLGREWNNYQYLFLLSALLRILCVPLAMRIKEPTSARTRNVITAMFEDWPMRMAALPAFLFRGLKK
ncbi:MAG: MFS transporter [Spirochaetes bacterium]|nr:MFS transporter [Spirochaetota bacterium]